MSWRGEIHALPSITVFNWPSMCYCNPIVKACEPESVKSGRTGVAPYGQPD
jgi:hypothetical protein